MQENVIIEDILKMLFSMKKLNELQGGMKKLMIEKVRGLIWIGLLCEFLVSILGMLENVHILVPFDFILIKKV
jgi:hypothetical protein